MNWKGFGMKCSWLNLNVLSQHLPGEITETHEKGCFSHSVFVAFISSISRRHVLPTDDTFISYGECREDMKFMGSY
jgi:hypothetical protein